jgi:rfaE bifunctional protein nucleotidyltransferase chain/domain
LTQASPAPSKTLTPLSEIAERRPLVLCHGVFDVLHPGHVEHLKQAKVLGGIGATLVVSVTADSYVGKGPNRPMFDHAKRMAALAALEVVDFVILSEHTDAGDTILQLHPDLFVKGADYLARTGRLTEEEALEKYGGKLAFTASESASSSAVINNGSDAFPDDVKEYLRTFSKEYSADQVLGFLYKLKDLNVLVVGERIIDLYTYVEPLAKSPREYASSFRTLYTEKSHGGTVAVMAHLQQFVASVAAVYQVPDIIKERFIAHPQGVRLFGIQSMETPLMTPRDEEKLIMWFEASVSRCDVVLVLDYGHGMMTDQVRQSVQALAPWLAVNVQTNSANYGLNLQNRYDTVGFRTMNEPEMALAAAAGSEPQRPWILTHGAKGSTIHPTALTEVDVHTPALSVHPKDRVGAGDALFAFASLLWYVAAPPAVVGFIANAAAALQCNVEANRSPIQAKELRRFIQGLMSW